MDHASPFPILYPSTSTIPRHLRLQSIPWGFVVLCRVRAEKNHGQSLETLAERGGLSPQELVCVLMDWPLRQHSRLNETEALLQILSIMAAGLGRTS